MEISLRSRNLLSDHFPYLAQTNQIEYAVVLQSQLRPSLIPDVLKAGSSSGDSRTILHLMECIVGTESALVRGFAVSKRLGIYQKHFRITNEPYIMVVTIGVRIKSIIAAWRIDLSVIIRIRTLVRDVISSGVVVPLSR